MLPDVSVICISVKTLSVILILLLPCNHSIIMEPLHHGAHALDLTPALGLHTENERALAQSEVISARHLSYHDRCFFLRYACYPWVVSWY